VASKYTKAHFTQGVKANVQLKSSICIGAKVEIGHKGFTLRVKAEIEKIFSICPKLLRNAELYGLVLAPRLNKEYHGIWEANLPPLGPMFQHLLALPTKQGKDIVFRFIIEYRSLRDFFGP
jgi:hypothetical protein